MRRGTETPDFDASGEGPPNSEPIMSQITNDFSKIRPDFTE